MLAGSYCRTKITASLHLSFLLEKKMNQDTSGANKIVVQLFLLQDNDHTTKEV